MIRGGIYPIDLGEPKRGREQSGRRYGLVISIQRDHWSVVTVIPTSTSAQPAEFRPEIEFNGVSTRLLIDQIRTIDTKYVTGEIEHYLTHDEMEVIGDILGIYLGLD